MILSQEWISIERRSRSLLNTSALDAEVCTEAAEEWGHFFLTEAVVGLEFLRRNLSAGFEQE